MTTLHYNRSLRKTSETQAPGCNDFYSDVKATISQSNTRRVLRCTYPTASQGVCHRQCPVLATADWGFRHDIAVIDGNVKSQRSLVPQKMCERLLQKLHRVHQGVNKSIQRARDTWFWPGMSGQIRRLILACPSFLEPQPRQKQAAVIPVITTNAMQIPGCEFSSITVDGIVDY